MAISVGNTHLQTKKQIFAKIDFDKIQKIQNSISTPIVTQHVLHEDF